MLRDLCARAAYFNPTSRADFALPLADRQARARECDASLSTRRPPAEATRPASGQQWRWTLATGTTCSCQIGRRRSANWRGRPRIAGRVDFAARQRTG